MAEAFQLAVKPEQVIELAAVAEGAEGVPGLTATAKDCAALVPQEFPAVTVIFPPEVPEVTVTDVVPCPAVMFHPEGTVHV